MRNTCERIKYAVKIEQVNAGKIKKKKDLASSVVDSCRYKEYQQ